MTKKEEILSFINESLDSSSYLCFYSVIQETKENCSMVVGATKARTLEIFTNNFDDELLGSMPNDSVVHQVISWDVVPR